MLYEWDDEKARRNLAKHGVSFEEASSVFSDRKYEMFLDPEHSDTESRFIIIGMSSRLRVLLVVFTEREGGTRIISARLATRTERLIYEEEL